MITLEKLKAQKQWVNWIYQKTSDNKNTKKPISPLGTVTGTNKKYANTWATFEEAKGVQHKYDGVGLIFKNGICGIDIDNCEQNSDIAQDIINLMDTYTELSPSGNGYHLLFHCDLNKLPIIYENNNFNEMKLDNKYYQKNPYNHLECYLDGITNRYFTFTENVVVNKPINDRTEQIIVFLNKYMLRDITNISKITNIDNNNYSLTNEEVISTIKRSKQAYKFHTLYNIGNTDNYNNDDSSADMALCEILAYYTQGNFNQIDELFCRSALYRSKWNRSDYKKATIEKSISFCNNKFYNKQSNNKKENAVAKDGTFSIEVLKQYLNHKGIMIKYNEITKIYDIQCNDDFSKEHITDLLPAIINNDLKQKYKYCDMTTIKKYLDVIGIENRHNPVIETLNNTKWDGKNYFKELTLILGIEKDELSCILLYKWFWQCISICKNNINNPFGADGILVLQGPQGIGKTTFVKKIAFNGRFCNLGKSINYYDKDTIRRCCSNWIVELGEIETTLKNDIEKFKSFITDEVDTYRLPYGASDLTLARRTSLIGTCNSFEYLIDTSGNRRFWTIPLLSINLSQLKIFNIEQLWAQLFYETKNNLQGFRLSIDEYKLLQTRNSKHEKKLIGEDEIIDILNSDNSKVTHKEITVTQFKEEYLVLRNLSSQQISRVLNKLGYEYKVKNKEKVRLLPIPKKRTLHDEIR